MNDDLKKLNEIAAFFKRMNSKIIILNLLNRAKAEYDKYDYSNAEETLTKVLAEDPQNVVALRGLGCLEQFKKNYDKAITYFTQALEFSTAKEVEYTLIGMAYYLQDKLDDSVENFNLAIDCNDNYDPAYEGRNQAMLERHINILDLQQSLKKYF